MYKITKINQSNIFVPNNKNDINVEQIINYAIEIKKDICNNKNVIEPKINDIVTRIQKRINRGNLAKSDIDRYRMELNSLTNTAAYNQNIEDFFKCCILLSKHPTNSTTKVNWFNITSETDAIKKVLQKKQDFNYQKDPNFSLISYNKNLITFTNELQNIKLDGLDLSGVNFEGLDLSGVNFTRVNFTGANLTGVNLAGAIFSGAIFSGVNFDDLDLSGIDFTGCNFTGCNFTGCDLTKAIFSGAIFSGVNFDDLDLSGIDFTGCNFTGCDFTGCNLTEAILMDVKFSGTNFENLDLSCILFINVKFTEVRFIGNILSHTSLICSNLEGTNFEKTDLSYTDFSEVNVNRVNFNGANVTGINFENINFESAQFNNVYIKGCNFKGAIFSQDTKITLSFTDNLDIDFNHINNSSSGSIFTAIASIDDKYKDIKFKLMQQIFQHLKDKNISQFIEPLKDILFNHQILDVTQLSDLFSAEPEFTKKFLSTIYQIGNTGNLDFNEFELNLHIQILNNMNNKALKQFTINNNGFFIQLIHSSNLDTAKNLYKKYLILHGIIDNEGNFLMKDLEREFYHYPKGFKESKVLVADTLPAINFLVVHNEYINKFIKNKNVAQITWNFVSYIKNGYIQPIEQVNLAQLFNMFVLFQASYTFAQSKVKFAKLLDLLDLGEYKIDFTTAIGQKKYKKDLTDKENQNKLNDIFNKYFNAVVDNNNEVTTPLSLVDDAAKNKLELAPDHINSIYSCYELTEDSPNREKAQLLLMLSGVFAKFSSSSFFGSEGDSPTAVRYYAYALMKAAYGLDESIIPVELMQEWENKFLGLEGAFTRTAVLSNLILEYCLKKFGETFVNQFKPSEWN